MLSFSHFHIHSLKTKSLQPLHSYAPSPTIVSRARKTTPKRSEWMWVTDQRQGIVDETRENRERKWQQQKNDSNARSSRRSFYCHKLHNKCLAMWCESRMLISWCDGACARARTHSPNARAPFFRSIEFFVLACCVWFLIFFSWQSSHAWHVVCLFLWPFARTYTEFRNHKLWRKERERSPRSNSTFFFLSFHLHNFNIIVVFSIGFKNAIEDERRQRRRSRRRRRRRRCERILMQQALCGQWLVCWNGGGGRKQEEKRRFIKWLCIRERNSSHWQTAAQLCRGVPFKVCQKNKYICVFIFIWLVRWHSSIIICAELRSHYFSFWQSNELKMSATQ